MDNIEWFAQQVDCVWTVPKVFAIYCAIFPKLADVLHKLDDTFSLCNTTLLGQMVHFRALPPRHQLMMNMVY